MTVARKQIFVYGMNFTPELTGVGRYTGELVFGLAARGYELEVVAAPPHYPGWYVRPPYSARSYRREDTDGTRVYRCPVFLHKSVAGVWRLVAPLSFAVFSAPVAFWRIVRVRPRTVLCVEPTLLVAPVALLAGKLVGARTVLHVQDLEIDAAFAVGHLKRGSVLSRLAFCIERTLLSAFDHVVTISDQMQRRLRTKGVRAERLSVIRNWVDTSKIFPLDRESSYRSELGIGVEQFVVLYSGQIGPKQALDVVFNAAEVMAGNSTIHFVIAGEGPLKKDFTERYGHLPNVHLIDLQPEVRLNELLNLADCHILPQDPAVKDLVLPSKLGGMLASGKQILIIADDDSEIAAFVGNSCARIAPSDVKRLPEVLRSLEMTRCESGSQARRAHAEQINIKSALDMFCTVLLPDEVMSAEVPVKPT